MDGGNPGSVFLSVMMSAKTRHPLLKSELQVKPWLEKIDSPVLHRRLLSIIVASKKML
jgi:hypothetical protein